MRKHTLPLGWHDIRAVIVGSLGNILEWYDFSLYAFMVPVFAKLFFPEQTGVQGTIMVFAVFFVGFIARPLGGVIFGHIGDKYGRSVALKFTVLAISMPTLATALLPTVANIGSAAPILLISVRIVQGICMGGEAAGSLIYLGEIAPKQHRAFVTSLTNSGANIGVLAATGLAALFSYYLSDQQLANWGWRVLYLIGAILGLVFYYYRRHLKETPVFTALVQQLDQQNNQQKSEPITISRALSNMKWPIFRVVLLICMGASLYYISYIYMPTYLQQYSGLSMPLALTIITIYNILSLVLIPLFGHYSDRFGRKIIVYVAVVTVGLAIICFQLILTSLISYIIIGTFILALLSMIEQGITPAILVETFPLQRRYTGLALGYNIAYCVIGGIAPMIVTELIVLTQQPTAPAFYMMIMALITGTTVYITLRKQKLSIS